ncbi:MAG: adenylyltransferase/cytidyltransferase family protein [Coriobacteriales bacterium]|jgi:cytidyltransferase-like protein|nr:adenylyltransferase/cytidyltransferase family protein [Coriobacteriales bacterium]
MLATESDKRWEIGYVSGSFDLFHVGHLNLLRNAKERCDKLVVGVLSDDAIDRIKHKRPVIPCADRLAIVAAIRYVDEVDETTIALLDKIAAWQKYHFGAMFSGDDHAHDGWAHEQDELRKRGAELVFFPYTPSVSTSMLRKELGR